MTPDPWCTVALFSHLAFGPSFHSNGMNAACVLFASCLPLMHWRKEHNFEAWSPENQVQPTNKGQGGGGGNTCWHKSCVYSHLADTHKDKAESISIWKRHHKQRVQCLEQIQEVLDGGVWHQRHLKALLNFKPRQVFLVSDLLRSRGLTIITNYFYIFVISYEFCNLLSILGKFPMENALYALTHSLRVSWPRITEYIFFWVGDWGLLVGLETCFNRK